MIYQYINRSNVGLFGWKMEQRWWCGTNTYNPRSSFQFKVAFMWTAKEGVLDWEINKNKEEEGDYRARERDGDGNSQKIDAQADVFFKDHGCHNR